MSVLHATDNRLQRVAGGIEADQTRTKRKDLSRVLGYPDFERTDFVHPSQPLTRSQKTKVFLKTVYKKLNLKHLVPALIIVLYTFFGAGVFIWIERDHDIRVRQEKYEELNEERERTEQKIFEVANEARLLRLQRLDIERSIHNELKSFEEKYAEIVGERFDRNTEWDFWNAMMYASTVYTTIGYGNLACITVSGRAFTMFYALCGIPLVLTTLNDLGIFLFKLIHRCCFNLSRLKKRFIQLGRTRRRNRAGKSLTKSSSAASLDDLETGRTRVESQSKDGESTDESDDEIMHSDDKISKVATKIPASAALFVTIGWLFLCSGLFCIWEKEWTYFTSVYFFVISLSTIGLGDVVPKNTRLMILMFPFVITGLSLVSMCIQVVQMRLEDLYIQLLLRLLTEYQKRVQLGGNKVDATIGMMEEWQNSKAAKLLNLLPAEKRAKVMGKFAESAKAQGMEIPPVLTDCNPETGLPRILECNDQLKNDSVEAKAFLNEMIEERIDYAEDRKQFKEDTDKPEMYEAACQNSAELIDGETQTTEQVKIVVPVTEADCQAVPLYSEEVAQTEDDKVSLAHTDSQTEEEEEASVMETAAQTNPIDTPLSAEHRRTQTDEIEHAAGSSQTETEERKVSDTDVQTEATEVAVAAIETQTEAEEKTPVSTSDTQTEVETKPDIIDSSAQYDLISDMVESTTQYESTIELVDADNQTIIDNKTSEQQTEKAEVIDSAVDPDVISSHEMEIQAEVPVDQSDQSNQTSHEGRDHGCQTDDMVAKKHSPAQTILRDLTDSFTQSVFMPGIDTENQTMDLAMLDETTQTDADPATVVATAKLREAFQQRKQRRTSDPGEDSNVASSPSFKKSKPSVNIEPVAEEPTQEDEEAKMTLQWDPVDGMHAERQKSVRDLKSMFEVSKKPARFTKQAKVESQPSVSATPPPPTATLTRGTGSSKSPATTPSPSSVDGKVVSTSPGSSKVQTPAPSDQLSNAPTDTSSATADGTSSETSSSSGTEEGDSDSSESSRSLNKSA